MVNTHIFFLCIIPAFLVIQFLVNSHRVASFCIYRKKPIIVFIFILIPKPPRLIIGCILLSPLVLIPFSSPPVSRIIDRPVTQSILRVRGSKYLNLLGLYN
jgi:hypothetical protein